LQQHRKHREVVGGAFRKFWRVLPVDNVTPLPTASSMSSPGSSSTSRVSVEGQAPLPKPADPAANLSSNEIAPLSRNPFFHVVLSKSHVRRSCLMGPSKDLIDILPSAEVPTVLKCGGESWDMVYRGHAPGRKFFDGGWRKFVKANCLVEGDACVFELMANSDEKIVFEVQILRGDLPEVFFKRDRIGASEQKPIVID
ncbi:hypothetical protein S83_040735, partial [Arachis hypogaea]